jgi:hypothetical protein
MDAFSPDLVEWARQQSAHALANREDGKKGEPNATMEFEEPASNVVSSTPEVLNTQEEDKLLFHNNKYKDSLEARDLSAALNNAMVQISVSEMSVDLEPEPELIEIAYEAARKLDTQERLNQRSSDIIPPLPAGLNTSSTTAVSPTEAAKPLTTATAAPPPPTATGADGKAATATNIKALGAIPKKTQPPLPPQEANVAPAPQEANKAAAYYNAQGNPSPAAGPSETNKPSTAAKGTKRAHQSPSSSSQRQAAAYSKVASVPKKNSHSCLQDARPSGPV